MHLSWLPIQTLRAMFKQLLSKRFTSLCSANRDTVVCVALTTYHTCQVEGELDTCLPFDKVISLKTIHNITQLFSNAPFFIRQNCHQSGRWSTLCDVNIFPLKKETTSPDGKIETLKTWRLNCILFTRRLVNKPSLTVLLITSPPSPIFYNRHGQKVLEVEIRQEV